MQHLNKDTVICVAGGVTVEKYDETTKEIYRNVRISLQDTLERLKKLDPIIAGGYAELAETPHINTEL